MATLLQWSPAIFDLALAQSGETIAGNTLSAGGGDGGNDTTLWNGISDYMSIPSLTGAGNILSQSADSVLDYNQGTIYLRLKFTDVTLAAEQILFGAWDPATGEHFFIAYKYNAGSPRLYFYINEDGGSLHYIIAYWSWTPVDDIFYDIKISWDADVNNSVRMKIDSGAWTAATSEVGTGISSIVWANIYWTTLFIGAYRTGNWTSYRGEISKVFISDVYQDTNLGEAVGGISIPIVMHHRKLRQ